MFFIGETGGGGGAAASIYGTRSREYLTRILVETCLSYLILSLIITVTIRMTNFETTYDARGITTSRGKRHSAAAIAFGLMPRRVAAVLAEYDIRLKICRIAVCCPSCRRYKCKCCRDDSFGKHIDFPHFCEVRARPPLPRYVNTKQAIETQRKVGGEMNFQQLPFPSNS